MEEAVSFQNLLDRIKTKFSRLAEIEGKQEGTLLSRFMDDIYELGLRLYQHPDLAQSPEFLAFRADTDKDSYAIWKHIQDYVRVELDGYATRNWSLYDGSQESALLCRSAIEFYFEIYYYDPTVAEDIDGIDETIKWQQEKEGGIDRPEMPPTHWWWHYYD